MARLFLVFLFRFLLLVVGGGFAALLGVALATVYPATMPKKPLVAKALEFIPGMEVSPENSERHNPTTAQKKTPQTQPDELSKAQRQQLQAELKVLENRLRTSRNRTALEARIQTIKQKLPDNNHNIIDTANKLADSPRPLIDKDTLRSSIPVDVLFVDNQAFLLLEGRPVLDRLIRELRNYSGATVVVGVHTDGVGLESDNRVLSFRQAEALTQYLSGQLDKKYHWLTVGYGETKPLVPNDSKTNRQRNRRVEIKLKFN